METEQRSMQPLVHIMSITIQTAGGLLPPERRSEAKVRSEGCAPFARPERSTLPQRRREGERKSQGAPTTRLQT